jgi:hypothetical protein
MKQTAVEWLQEALMTSENAPNYNQWAFKKAKEMEKQQIVDSFGVGCQVESTRLIGYHKMAEQYYNETFKSE